MHLPVLKYVDKDANKEAEKRKKAQDHEDCAPTAARKLNKDKVSVGELTV